MSEAFGSQHPKRHLQKVYSSSSSTFLSFFVALGRAKGSNLALWFSKDAPLCPDGLVFLDRNGDMFRLILEWLRTGTLSVAESEIEALRAEAHFFKV
jgi:hypothetical protein